MAAANSLQTRPSHSARIAPNSQPSMHCGPPMAPMIRGIVINGPTPTMLLMLRAVACRRPKLRTKPYFSLILSRLFSKVPASVAEFAAAKMGGSRSSVNDGESAVGARERRYQAPDGHAGNFSVVGHGLSGLVVDLPAKSAALFPAHAFGPGEEGFALRVT